MRKKKLNYWLVLPFSIILFSAVIYALNSSVFIYEFGLKANKYVDLNVEKNRGLKKTALEITRFFLQLHPRPKSILYHKTDTEVGSKHSPRRVHVPASNPKPISRVNNVAQLIAQFSLAKAGDTIVIAPGHYVLTGKRFKLKNGGTAGQKITLMAESFGTVFLQLDSVEGLYLAQPHWSIHNLIFEGVCQYDNNCEHAIHLTRDADHVEIINNRFINFNAHIKSNGVNMSFPDNVTISGNDFYNQSPRNTNNPVTPIDVVGGNDWLIAYNFIADFALKQGDKFTASYGAFLKGSGQRGEIVGNVVNCAWNVPHQSFLDIRIGLSLGGGGTGGAYCQDAACDYEHKDGVIENNLVLNCQNDVSIYLNKAPGSKVKDNVLLNSLGIDARFAITTATIENNQYQGRIKARNGAWIRDINNNNIALNDMPASFIAEN